MMYYDCRSSISKRAEYRWKVTNLLIEHLFNCGELDDKDKFDLFGIYGFYADRLKSAIFYGLVQGREMIKMICRAAFNDSRLTDNEAIVIMETCLDLRLDNILMEVNFNEGW